MLLDTGKVDVHWKDKDERKQLSRAKEILLSKSHSYGNSTLQDFQTQLMLLEQQNKERLLMAGREHGAVVKMLLGTGKVDVDSKDESGRTPLSWAAEKGRGPIVKMLLDIGKVDVDSKDNDGRTPLSWAAEKGCGAVVKMLLDIDTVDVDSKDEGGRTPLSWAADTGDVAVVKMLLDTGKVDIE
jgi:ankyrin repeat protein